MKNWLINCFYFYAGILFLLLAKTRNAIKGYTPKTFPLSETQRCIQYDLEVVDNWLSCLRGYEKNEELASVRDKAILELGPGSDLGVGLYLLSKSAKRYSAIDIYDLASTVPDQFYTEFFACLKNEKQADIQPLQEELEKTKSGNNDRLNYICNKNFDIKNSLPTHSIDIIFSNAAFEHFDNIHKTISDVTDVASSGAIFVVLVDLKTHSRWIRDKDPNNIYRYPGWLYRLLSTQSTPNRVRPYQYKEALEKNGWENVTVVPDEVLHKDIHGYKKYLNNRFRDEENQMDYLTVWICAAKK